MTNLSLWEAVAKTDPAFTKKFQRGGGFKGTATNATYLAKRATEQFGPCGIGWGVTVLDERLLDGADGVKVHRVHIELWYILDGKRGIIQHFGQTEFCGKRASGHWYTDEEAPKKSLTDATSKALSLLGFASDIHMGLYDDNKYVAGLKEEFDGKPRLVEPEPALGPITPAFESSTLPHAAIHANAEPELGSISVNGEQVRMSAYAARKGGTWEPLVSSLRACPSMDALAHWKEAHEDEIAALPVGWWQELQTEYQDQKHKIRTRG